jgi:pimeloyl-ACP methyl ester carboxylesterase
MGDVSEQRGTVDGLQTRWFEAPVPAGAAPVLYVHGVPNHGGMWQPFLERSGGLAPDLPGFGDSDKPNGFDYSIDGYREWLTAFVAHRGLDRFSVVVHDWGGVGLALAQAMPERIERLVIIDSVPFLPGYRWHWLARLWRRPVIGEMTMGFTFRRTGKFLVDRGQRKPYSDAAWDEVYKHFDHGTQRAILRLYRSAPPDVLARAGANLGALTAPALVVWGAEDIYLPTHFAEDYAAALGGDATVRLVDGAGHWVWDDEPGLIDEVAGFLRG